MIPRLLRLATAAAAVVALTVGCSSGGGTDAPAAQAPTGDTFPVTVAHKLGSTVIPAAPQRVVTVGLRDHDFVLALGVKPVGVAEWYPELKGGIGPWAREAMGPENPPVVATIDAVNIEAVAAQSPDLIISVYGAADKAVYDKLSQIAPTVAAPEGTEDYALSWQQELDQVGKALGRSAQARTLTADTERKLADAKAAHPEFAGKSAIYGGLGGEPGAYTSTDQRGRFLTSLGFRIPESVDKLATAEEAYFVGISKENYREFDTDVAVLIGDTADPAAAVRAEPLYGRLANVTQGRALFLDELNGAWSAALSYDSPLSLPYVVDGFVPALGAAADGNPATAVPAEPSLATANAANAG
ncbi:iron complex transport system substrate-binding protein [Pseudonocardia sediminis]|uniref:Iron complex transport system substrate-binding protein n=1 Tax=Pseudonocardia sediminis TaxID=1397368 RepID=A0A4V2FQL0_PSEST|nr:iron-siderophore ABC transporter substrate-binding protein [Pseudonocardia sediminis]RZT85100.1 iron complex transport system substrate-binding protein [Pseudonocardia sediminis]